MFLGKSDEVREAQDILEGILIREPSNQPARFYLAMTLRNGAKELSRAIVMLEVLLSEQTEDAEIRNPIERQLQRIKVLLKEAKG